MKTLKSVLSGTTRPRAMVFDVVSFSGTLPSLFKLCHWAKMAPPRGSHALQGQGEKAMVFGNRPHL